MNKKGQKKKTEQDLIKIAYDINNGTIFSAWNIAPCDLKSNLSFVFLPIMFGGMPTFEIGLVYSYFDESMPRGANGYPCFSTAYYLTVDEAKVVRKKLDELQPPKMKIEKNPDREKALNWWGKLDDFKQQQLADTYYHNDDFIMTGKSSSRIEKIWRKENPKSE